ncbi:hypothetical protein CCO03_16610 [Comamonas serinivorans]|uniref:Uncharacterized protein n=1 Tax=Comamonas serinivorans TaxID=1082851 RepID=A0A1Y0ERQ4_9BURK|nr:hypothetical protein CCO03_16610 [Comamonas serinivorans]
MPAAEVILVRTLLRLFAHDASFQWRFVEEAPYDALIVDGANSDQAVKAAAQQARAVLALTRTLDADGPNRLSRPLRADRLKLWLESVEDHPVEVKASAPSPLEAEVAAPSPSEPETAFKLRRWPPVGLLHRDPIRIRMATLMSRRYLKVSELASITGLSPQEVQPFLHNLQLVGLVELKREREPSPTPQAQQIAAPETPSAGKGFFGKGLIGSIRKRLGL